MQKFTHFEIIVDFGFFDFFQNPDLDDVQSAVKHSKIVENFKISIFPKNIVLELPFGIGFIKIHQQARFLCFSEIC